MSERLSSIYVGEPQELLNGEIGITSEIFSTLLNIRHSALNAVLKRNNIGIYDEINKTYILTELEVKKYLMKNKSTEGERYLFYMMLHSAVFFNCLHESVPDFLIFLCEYEPNKRDEYIIKTKFPFGSQINYMPHVFWVYCNLNLFENIEMDVFWEYWKDLFYLYSRGYGAEHIYESFCGRNNIKAKPLGHMYILECQFGNDKLCKIGWADKPKERFKQFVYMKKLRYHIFETKVEQSVEFAFHSNHKSLIHREWYSKDFDEMRQITENFINNYE